MCRNLKVKNVLHEIPRVHIYPLQEADPYRINYRKVDIVCSPMRSIEVSS